MICHTCQATFDAADSVGSGCGVCQDCWERRCAENWWNTMSVMEPIENTYPCRFIGGPLDGAVIECDDLGHEAVPHGGGYAFYARVGREQKRFVGFGDDLVRGDQLCEAFRERVAEEFCDGM